MDKLCAWCGRNINHLKKNAVYCSDGCRSSAHRAAPCFYCGMPAAEREHIIPLSKQRNNNTETVPTCYECNRLAGVEQFDTVEEKRSYVQARILKKYKKVIEMPDWEDSEIEELGPTLRGHVLGMIELKLIICERLSYRGSNG